ncbi:pyridoxamine 5'-phosphate oxidase family protein [Rhodococcus chondri]|uniref:Pyridoxamine 5'-phosphate oxidase family protein n=1 Tax=Rhodococcus chondri TaxID=3065941 RepID=A0ABU7JZK6_9NOCA|nr:pyridoxamine 5'-phosphate oxidase family protein [Rhodococcus sp. CC-R104]MEE2035451.1 pyridoxamine 5'-phosphate oxidase family protein [Rhodococcus sp. CC-R104]
MTTGEAVGRQRRGRSIAMSSDEVDMFLAEQRTCRVATVGGDGSPHVAPLWFVWDGAFLWLNSIVRSQRWADLRRDRRIAVVVDSGEQFTELRGVEIRGTVAVVGDVPRGSGPDGVLHSVELAFARKYSGRDEFVSDGRHAWLRVTADSVVSWDFGKNRRR